MTTGESLLCATALFAMVSMPVNISLSCFLDEKFIALWEKRTGKKYVPVGTFARPCCRSNVYEMASGI